MITNKCWKLLYYHVRYFTNITNSKCPICFETINKYQDGIHLFTYINKHGTYGIHVNELSQYILKTGRAQCPLTRSSLSIADIYRLDKQYYKYIHDNKNILQTNLLIRTYHPKWLQYDKQNEEHEEKCQIFKEFMEYYTQLLTHTINYDEYETNYYIEHELPQLSQYIIAFSIIDCSYTIIIIQQISDQLLQKFPHPKFMLVMSFLNSLIHDITLKPHTDQKPKKPKIEIYNGDTLPSHNTIQKWVINKTPPII